MLLLGSSQQLKEKKICTLLLQPWCVFVIHNVSSDLSWPSRCIVIWSLGVLSPQPPSKPNHDLALNSAMLFWTCLWTWSALLLAGPTGLFCLLKQLLFSEACPIHLLCPLCLLSSVGVLGSPHCLGCKWSPSSRHTHSGEGTDPQSSLLSLSAWRTGFQ